MESQTVYCGRCGQGLSPAARFCPSCGERQEAFDVEEAAQPDAAEREWLTDPQTESIPAGGASSAQPEERLADRAAHRLEQASPEAGELAMQLKAQLGTPGVILAGVAALGGFAACLVVGFAAALALPERTTIGVYGAGADLISETLRLAVGTTMARLEVTGLGTDTIMPLTFLLAPIGGTAAAAYSQSSRTSAQPPRMRLVWGAAAAIPFALLMMTITLVAGGSFFGYELDFAIGSVLFYSLLWGAVGGVLGTWLAIRRNAPETVPEVVPPQAARPLRALTSTLKPLVVCLAISSVIGLVAWEAQTLKGEQTAKGGRSTVAALVENVLFVPNLGLTTSALGMFSEFRRAQFQQTTAGPLPVSDDQVDDLARNLSGSEPPTGRILAYRDAVPAYVFIPGLLLLTLIPLTLVILAPLWAGSYVIGANL